MCIFSCYLAGKHIEQGVFANITQFTNIRQATAIVTTRSKCKYAWFGPMVHIVFVKRDRCNECLAPPPVLPGDLTVNEYRLSEQEWPRGRRRDGTGHWEAPASSSRPTPTSSSSTRLSCLA